MSTWDTYVPQDCGMHESKTLQSEDFDLHVDICYAESPALVSLITTAPGTHDMYACIAVPFAMMDELIKRLQEAKERAEKVQVHE